MSMSKMNATSNIHDLVLSGRATPQQGADLLNLREMLLQAAEREDRRKHFVLRIVDLGRRLPTLHLHANVPGSCSMSSDDSSDESTPLHATVSVICDVLTPLSKADRQRSIKAVQESLNIDVRPRNKKKAPIGRRTIFVICYVLTLLVAGLFASSLWWTNATSFEAVSKRLVESLLVSLVAFFIFFDNGT